MEFEKRYEVTEAASIINGFITRYVDRSKIPKRILLWNSLKDEIKTECYPFSKVMSLDFFYEKTLFVYDERERILWKTKWANVVLFINCLEPWEENIDILLFDESLDWFVAITHEELLTLCAGTIIF